MSSPISSARHRWWLAFAWSTLGTLAAPADQSPAPLAAPPPTPQLRPLAYFPPDPPPLGAPLPAAHAAGDPAATAPAELGAFVNEPFYAVLASRLALHDLSQAQQRHIEAYRETKTALQTELWAHLDALKDLDAAARRQTLETFAHDQTPRIAQLEETAEQLRRGLASGWSFSGFARNEYRDTLDSMDRVNQAHPASRAYEGQAMRVAAFFLDGLSPAQRRLLREVALELAEPGPGSAGAAIPPADAAPGFFSPDLTRVRLPADLPAVLAAQVAAYAQEKSALKQELRHLLWPPADEPLPRALEHFARQQAPRIDALERLADDIRRGLAQLPNRPAALGRLRLPPLSPELEARVTSYRREKLELQNALLARVEEATQRRTASGVPVGKSKSGPAVAGGEPDEKIRQAITAFTRENADRYAVLEKSKDALRSDLARLAGTGAIVVNGPFADVLSQHFSEALRQLETWRTYRDYQVAVFEPGLSPEQRRLLFDLVVEKLALPLPAGVIPPDRKSP